MGLCLLGLGRWSLHSTGAIMEHRCVARGRRWKHDCCRLAVQARVAGVEDRLLWLDGFQSAEALSELLLCGSAFVAPFDEQSPTSVSRLRDTSPSGCNCAHACPCSLALLLSRIMEALRVTLTLVCASSTFRNSAEQLIAVTFLKAC